ncbi:MAG: hypothetical protein M3Y26_08770 [Actinomycetota bacterium]|nr:hypothetical protein [Actinomycetota bacterium]
MTAAELREKKLALDEARAKAREARELEGLELELRFSDELGPRGAAFEMVDSGDLGEGFLVVKLGSEVLLKRFVASKTTTPEDISQFVRPCLVHPAPELFDEIVSRRPALASRAAHALMNLFGLKKEDEAGK